MTHWEQVYMKKTLKARFKVIGAVIITVLLLTLSFLLFGHVSNSLISDTTEMYLSENARAVASIFNTKLDDQLIMLESQVRYFRDINLSDYNAMKDTIIATKGIGAFKNIGVANSTGATINYNGRSSGNILLTDYFREAMQGQNAISEITYIDEDGDEVLVLAVPIVQSGKVMGAVYGTFTKDILNSLIDTVSFAESGANLLLDSDGTILARSADNNLIGEDVVNFNDVTDISGYSGGDESVFYYKSGVNDMLAVLIPIGLHDWNFVTVLPRSVISELSSKIALYVLLVIVAVALSFMLLLWSIVTLFKEIRGMNAEKQRLGAELGVATKIQADMMPYNFPERPDLTLYASMTPAKEVGGDFYDFFFIDDDHIALVMADVSGKGVPAALFMVSAKSVIRNMTMISRMTAEQIIEHANNILCENNKSGFFVTLWLGILTLSSGEMHCVNAGHEYPAIKRANGKFELLVGDNCPPLAAMENIDFIEETITLSKGDCLFLYTDGVPEAKNADGARFGTDKMLEVLNDHKEGDMVATLTDLKKEIDDFTGIMDPFDDVTMMGLRYNGV